MPKKGENIYKRKDGRWEGRYIKGVEENEKVCYGYVYGDRYDYVKKQMSILKHRHAGKRALALGRKGTFAKFATTWLTEAAGSTVRPLKPSTVSLYEILLHTHLLPAFGKRRIDSLTEEDVDMLVKSLMRQDLKASSVRNTIRLLGQIMRVAVSYGILLSDPCVGVALPKKDASQIVSLRLHEQRKLERTAAQCKDGLVVLIALYTGMRIGEICALKWEDVDLDNGLLRVRNTVQRISMHDAKVKTKLVVGTPKSAYADRTIPLTPTLRQHLKAEKGECASEYVISSNGALTEPRTIRYRFASIVKAAGIEPIRFHAMRHTFATRCVETGMDVTTLSRLLGHASVKMTLDVYTDSTPECKRLSIRKLEKLHRPVPDAAVE
jgi:integrase